MTDIKKQSRMHLKKIKKHILQDMREAKKGIKRDKKALSRLNKLLKS